MDIIIAVGGADARGIDDFLESTEDDMHVFFRGRNRASIDEGEHVFLQSKGKIWGYLTFSHYGLFDDCNLEGEPVRHHDALHAKGPFREFDTPVPLLRHETKNYGYRYIDASKFSGQTLSALRKELQEDGQRLNSGV